MAKCILNHRILDLSEAHVHISDLALLRAYGIFDFFRCVGLQPLYFQDHIERFYRSADHLRLKCPVRIDELQSLILEVIEENAIQDSGIRLVLTGGESPNGYAIGNPTLFVINEPINPLPETQFTEGIKLISQEYLRDIPEVKTINYLMGIYKMPDMKAAGATDILYHWEGKIAELTRSNFFIVDDEGQIITAKDGVLKGINRKHVMKVASESFQVVERDLYMHEIPNAREAFITGTTKKVMPVVKIDDITIGDGMPGPVTRKLQEAYDHYISEWLHAQS